MNNKFFLLIIYLLLTFSISAMENKAIILVKNNSKDYITFAYKRHDLKNDTIYDNDTFIGPQDFQSIALPTATPGQSSYTYYLNIPNAIPEKVTFKLGQNETIQSGNIIEIHETDEKYTICRKDQQLCSLDKQQTPTILYFGLNLFIKDKTVNVKNLLVDPIQLKYAFYHNHLKRREITEYIYTKENLVVLNDCTHSDVELIIPIIFNKIILKKGYTTDIFYIQLSKNKKFVEIINHNNNIIDTLIARFPLRTTIFNIDTQEIETFPIQ